MALAVVIVLMVVAPGLIPATSPVDVQAAMNTPGMTLALMAAVGFNQVMVIAFSLLVIRWVIGPDWFKELNLRRPAGRHIGLALLSLPAMWLLGNYSGSFFGSIFPSLFKMDQVGDLFSRWPWPLAVLIIGVGPGIGEELWCRGFLGRGLVGRYGVGLGVVFTSFFFGLIHVDPPQGAMAMLLGLWLHFVYLTTRSLYLPMLLHFLNNTLSVLVPRWLDPTAMEVVDRTSTPLAWCLAGASLGLLLLVGWGLYRSRSRSASS